ncbi:MAG: haloacid dehalogenase-like hydrolase [Planctomycetaceae bacterium]|nr:haloacid dehalogenase-like hydrolase [Planctomycetaceae bacterium]
MVFVDLDGTLISTDLFYEAIVQAIRHDPRLLLQFPSWLLRGRAHLKQRLSERIAFDVRHLPCRSDVLELLAEARACGTRLVLATASDRAWAASIAEQLGIFDDVLASDGVRNL